MAAPQLVDPPIWYCSPNLIKCQHGHPLLTHKSAYAVDQRRVDGHAFLACKTCNPTTYFLGVISSKPSPIVHCFALTREQYDYWIDHPDDELDRPLELDHETEDLLHRLGYNPGYQRRTP
ncbi:MAG TPA: hypothetical protein VJO33_17145 [Gemmatimonadaceae bacterium]|nr:hypothetical protein [Gemmatimonadaceae bacterium]